MDNTKIKDLLTAYLTRTTEEVKRWSRNGQGREIIGEVINRPEDIEIGIDRVGEQILEELLKKYGIAATIYSEPENRDIKNGTEFYGSLDPFDGSALFLKGFEHNWYTAVSFYDKEKKPVATGIADIINEKFYIMDGSQPYCLDTKNGKKNLIRPSNQKNIAEPIVLATYLMKSLYSAKFLDAFGGLIKSMHDKSLLYPQGGSFIYAFLASGLVDAYVMFNEPRSEIDPGFPIAKQVGCSIVSVNQDGSYHDYEFLPGRQHDKVDLLIAAATPELRDELINYYVKS